MNTYVICLVCLIAGGVVGAFIGYDLSEIKNRHRWRLKGYFDGWDDAEKLYTKYPRQYHEEVYSKQLRRSNILLKNDVNN